MPRPMTFAVSACIVGVGVGSSRSARQGAGHHVRCIDGRRNNPDRHQPFLRPALRPSACRSRIPTSVSTIDSAAELGLQDDQVLTAALLDH